MLWLLSCEHYCNDLPPEYADLFLNAVDVLESHRGYDIGVAPLYTRLKSLFDEAFFYPYSRLLVEPNRSMHHRRLFSEFTLCLSGARKAELLDRYYRPYRDRVEQYIQNNIDQGVMHISVHSFTPFMENQRRQTPLGILFDSRRKPERDLAVVMKNCFREVSPSTQVRFNYPYRGNADGFTSYLRKRFPENYVGFELEVRNDVIPDLGGDLYEGLTNMREGDLLAGVTG